MTTPTPSATSSPTLSQSPTGKRSQTWSLLSFCLYNGLLLTLLLFTSFGIYEFLVVVYFELGEIGFFALLKLVVAALFGDPFNQNSTLNGRVSSLFIALLLAVLFLSKFGLLMLGLGAVLLFLPSELNLQADWRDLNPWVEFCLWAMLLSYTISFLRSYVFERNFEKTSVLKPLFLPYARGWWVGVTIFAGAVLSAESSGDPTLLFTLIVFALKVALDLLGLLWELRRERTGARTVGAG